MRKLLSMVAVVLLTFSAVVALAADLTGTWSGQMSGPGGDFSMSFTFKQDGAKLTGTVTGPQGDPLEITDGKVDGDKMSFTVSFNGMTIKHEGVLKGNELKITTHSDDGGFPGGEMTLKRAQ